MMLRFTRLPSLTLQRCWHGCSTSGRSAISNCAVRPTTHSTTLQISQNRWLSPLSSRLLNKLPQVTGYTVSKRYRRDDDYFRPFDIDTNVAKDTLVYSFKDDRHFLYLGIFGIVMIVFWSELAYEAFRKYYLSVGSPQNNSMAIISLIESKVKHIISPVFFLFGALAFAYSVVMPHRTITALTLLRGGKSVRLETYSFMNFRRSFEVPLDMVSCSRARDVNLSTHHQMSLKVKDRMFYFQLDKKNGKFVEPTLFDFAIGLKRF